MLEKVESRKCEGQIHDFPVDDTVVTCVSDTFLLRVSGLTGGGRHLMAVFIFGIHTYQHMIQLHNVRLFKMIATKYNR